jgi:hypothetical protein
LEASDAPIHAPIVHHADLQVSCDSGAVHLAGKTLETGTVKVTLDMPIDLVVTGWRPRILDGVSATGHLVTLAITPACQGDAAVAAEILVDHSGSMGSLCTWNADSPLTTHQALVVGLRTAATDLHAGDRVRLWEFDDTSSFIGEGDSTDFMSLIDKLSLPAGGTEIGSALLAATAGSGMKDVLLITDGKSYALDVQRLARSGKRFTVVLIGDDSLEANVGHLAALSGGQIFAVSGLGAAEAIAAAFASIRTPHLPAKPIDGELRSIQSLRGGMLVEAQWADHAGQAGEDARIVGAVAAALALPRLDEETAANLAEAHRIVCHLTSLVLVDEVGEAQKGLPAQRKVPLSTPQTDMMFCEIPFGCDVAFCVGPSVAALQQGAALDPASAAARIDWGSDPEALRQGNLNGLDPAVAMTIRHLATLPTVINLAVAAGLSVTATVIGLLAKHQAVSDRAAARLFRTLLGSIDPIEVKGVMLALRL